MSTKNQVCYKQQSYPAVSESSLISLLWSRHRISLQREFFAHKKKIKTYDQRERLLHILSTAIAYLCVIATKCFLNGADAEVNVSISKGLVHLNTTVHRLYMV